MRTALQSTLSSPLLTRLLEQTGINSLVNGTYEVLDLYYDQNTNQYYGELKLTLSNTGLKLGLSDSSSVFGNSTMTPVEDPPPGGGTASSGTSLTLTASFSFSKLNSRSIVQVLQNYMGGSNARLLIDILMEMSNMYGKDLFVHACDSLRYFVSLEEIAERYKLSYDPTYNFPSSVSFEDAAGGLYVLLAQEYDVLLVGSATSQVDVPLIIEKYLCDVNTSVAGYDVIQFESRLTSIFSPFLGPYSVAKAKFQLHFYYKLALKLEFEIPLSTGFIAANTFSNPDNYTQQVTFKASSADVVFSNYQPFSLNTPDPAGNLAFVKLSLSPGGSKYKLMGLDLILSEFGDAYLDLSSEVNIPGLDALGLPPSSMGVYIESAKLSNLPINLKTLGGQGELEMKLRGIFLGSNGFSGLVQLAADFNAPTKPAAVLGIGGLKIEFDQFSVLFQANRPISSNITGSLDLSAFKIEERAPFKLEWYNTNSYILSITPSYKARAEFSILDVDIFIDFTFKDLIIHYYKDYSLTNPDQKLELSSSGSAIISTSSDTLTKFLGETIIDYWVKFDSLGKVDGGISIGAANLKNGLKYRHEFKNDISFNFGKHVKLLVGPLALEVGWSSPSITFENLANNFEIEVAPPKYLGVELDFNSVKGSGLISANDDYTEFSGLLALTLYKKYTISAMGIYSTTGGQNSFIGLVTVEGFPGIPLGLGFQMVGIGGILGVNRRYDNDFIVRGLSTGNINKLLFPKSDLKVLADVLPVIDRAFPAQKDNYVFGLSAKIVWGEKVGQNSYIFTSKLALVFSFPTPFIIALLGTGQVLLPPTDGDSLVTINFAFSGVYNTSRGLITFDAELYDSKILFIRMQGQYLVRILLGSNNTQPDFLMSAGGYHPDYEPEPSLMAPKHDQVKRIAIVIADLGSLSITSESYFAIAKNAVMFGNRSRLYAEFAGANINGQLTFDTLVRFTPFSFVAAFSASIDVNLWGRQVACLGIGGQISGPNPWYVYGRVEFEIWFFKFSSDFSYTWPAVKAGERQISSSSVDYVHELDKQIDIASNFSTPQPPTKLRGVGLADSSGTGLFIDPSGGVVEFKQDRVPLRVEILNSSSKENTLIFIEKVYINDGSNSTDFWFNFDHVLFGSNSNRPAQLVDFKIDFSVVTEKVLNIKSKSNELSSYFLTSLYTDSANDVSKSIKERQETYAQQVSGIKIIPFQQPGVTFGIDATDVVDFDFYCFGDNMSPITLSSSLYNSLLGPNGFGNLLEEVPDGSFDLPVTSYSQAGTDGLLGLSVPDLESEASELAWVNVQSWMINAVYHTIEEEVLSSSVWAADTNLELYESQYKVVLKLDHTDAGMFGGSQLGYSGSFAQVQSHLEAIRLANPYAYNQLTFIAL